jgi:hypothetical protein
LDEQHHPTSHSCKNQVRHDLNRGREARRPLGRKIQQSEASSQEAASGLAAVLGAARSQPGCIQGGGLEAAPVQSDGILWEKIGLLVLGDRRNSAVKVSIGR